MLARAAQPGIYSAAASGQHLLQRPRKRIGRDRHHSEPVRKTGPLISTFSGGPRFSTLFASMMPSCSWPRAGAEAVIDMIRRNRLSVLYLSSGAEPRVCRT